MSKKILIVDDEPDAIYIVEGILSDIEGIDTISAENGEKGLEKARQEKPDMIILDVQMPGMSGFDVFTHICKDDSLKNIPVMMLTGIANTTGVNFSANDMKSFLGQEPAAYLEKPVDPSLLQKTVKAILHLS